MHTPRAHRIALRTGLSYNVLEWGADSPAAAQHVVVLLHGFLDCAWTWQQTVDSGLFGRYRLIAPDLRGHGDSDRVGPGGYYYFMDYLADLHDLLSQLIPDGKDGATEAPRVSLVGHSMGGSVASYFAGTYPERVHRLAMLDYLGPPIGDDSTLATMPDRVRTWVAAWARVARQPPSRPIDSVDEVADRLMLRDERLRPDLARWLAEHTTTLLPDGKRRFKHDPLHMTPGPYPFLMELAQAFWRRVRCPTLVVAAGNSEYEYDEAIAHARLRDFADARLVKLPDCGHMLQRHQPAALARLLIDFLG